MGVTLEMRRLFFRNAFYLLAHHRRILSDNRMAMCGFKTDGRVFGYGPMKKELTLGCYMDLWVNCPVSRFYSRTAADASEGNGDGKGHSMMKALIYTFWGHGIGDGFSYPAVMENGKNTSAFLNPYLDYMNSLVRICCSRFQSNVNYKGQIFSLQQVIDELKKEDREQFRDEEEAEENFRRVIDEVFADTTQWQSNRSYFCFRDDQVLNPSMLQTVKNRIVDLIRSFPESLRSSDECVRLMNRIEAEKDRGTHDKINFEAGEPDISLEYYSAEYFKLVLALRTDQVLMFCDDYRDIREKKAEELKNVRQEIREVISDIRSGTVSREDGVAEISCLREIKGDLLEKYDGFLEKALTIILGRDCYTALNFDCISAVDRFVAAHKHIEPAG